MKKINNFLKQSQIGMKMQIYPIKLHLIAMIFQLKIHITFIGMMNKKKMMKVMDSQ